LWCIWRPEKKTERQQLHDFKVLLTMIFFFPSSPPRCLNHQIKTMGPGAAFQEDNLPEGRTDRG